MLHNDWLFYNIGLFIVYHTANVHVCRCRPNAVTVTLIVESAESTESAPMQHINYLF